MSFVEICKTCGRLTYIAHKEKFCYRDTEEMYFRHAQYSVNRIRI